MTSVCALKYQKLSVLPSHRKLDGTCGFTTFTRFFLLWRCYLWRHLPTKQCSVFSTNLWLWSQMELNPSLTLSRRAIFRSDPFQKQARYLEWGELMIADASGGGGGGYTWGPLGSPVLSQKARLLRLHTRLWMPLAAIIKQSTSVVKWLCVEQNPKAYQSTATKKKSDTFTCTIRSIMGFL